MGTYIKLLQNYEKKLLDKGIVKIGPTITVSGLSGSGKSLIGESLSRAFKLKLVSMGDIFRELAAEKGMRIEQFDKVRKKDVDLMLDKKTLELAMHGNIIILARISGWVAGDHADYKLWVDCDLKTRIKRTAVREQITLAEARKYLNERDNANTKRYKQIYKINQNDLSIYDVILDNAHMSKEQAERIPVHLVHDALRKKKIFRH